MFNNSKPVIGLTLFNTELSRELLSIRMTSTHTHTHTNTDRKRGGHKLSAGPNKSVH